MNNRKNLNYSIIDVADPSIIVEAKQSFFYFFRERGSELKNKKYCCVAQTILGKNKTYCSKEDFFRPLEKETDYFSTFSKMLIACSELDALNHNSIPLTQ